MWDAMKEREEEEGRRGKRLLVKLSFFCVVNVWLIFMLSRNIRYEENVSSVAVSISFMTDPN